MRLRAQRAQPLRGRVRPPGDKSISHRALILGALAEGETPIDGLLEGEDVLRTAAAMQQLGAEIHREELGRWSVRGLGAAGLQEPVEPLDFGNSGTGARLCMGAAAARPIFTIVVGDESLSRRPMARVLEPLKRMGGQILARQGGLLPAAINGAAEPLPLRYETPIASAQVKSAILIAGLRAGGDTIVTEPGASRDHTERMLSAFGADVESRDLGDGKREIALRGPAVLRGQPVAVPGDPSSAAFPVAAMLLSGAPEVLVEDVGLNPLRAGFFETLKEMGVQATLLDEGVSGGEPYGMLRLRPNGPLQAVSPPAERAPTMIDEFPILAVLAAFAEGETRLTGAADLRVKESDRIALVVAGLRACGVACEELPDGMIIAGRGPDGVKGGAEIATQGDHRIAMAFLTLGLAAQEPVIVDGGDMIATSFPNFVHFMRALGADIAELD